MMLRGSLVLLLLVAVVAFCEAGDKKYKLRCKARGRTLVRYKGNGSRDGKMHITFPCKYPAVRQQCGLYYVQITPSMRAVRETETPWYVMDKLHIVIQEKSKGITLWKGRITEDLAEQFLNGTRDSPLSQLPNEMLPFVIKTFKNKRVVIGEMERAFEITFQPHRLGASQKSAKWSFTCFDVPKKDEVVASEQQMCTDNDETGVSQRAELLEFTGPRDVPKIKAFFHDVLTNDGITQTDPTCEAASSSLSDCPVALRREAIDRCWRIIGKVGHTRCVRRNGRPIMEVFTDCVNHVCSSAADMSSCPASLMEAFQQCENTKTMKCAKLFPADDAEDWDDEDFTDDDEADEGDEDDTDDAAEGGSEDKTTKAERKERRKERIAEKKENKKERKENKKEKIAEKKENREENRAEQKENKKERKEDKKERKEMQKENKKERKNEREAAQKEREQRQKEAKKEREQRQKEAKQERKEEQKERQRQRKQEKKERKEERREERRERKENGKEGTDDQGQIDDSQVETTPGRIPPGPSETTRAATNPPTTNPPTTNPPTTNPPTTNPPTTKPPTTKPPTTKPPTTKPPTTKPPTTKPPTTKPPTTKPPTTKPPTTKPPTTKPPTTKTIFKPVVKPCNPCRIVKFLWMKREVCSRALYCPTLNPFQRIREFVSGATNRLKALF